VGGMSFGPNVKMRKYYSSLYLPSLATLTPPLLS